MIETSVSPLPAPPVLPGLAASKDGSTAMPTILPGPPGLSALRPAALRPALRLWRCRRGASAVEFALTVPALVALLLAVMEIAMVLLVQVLLEGGVRDASRYGITGQQPDGQTREERIVEIVSRHTLGLVEISADQVDVRTFSSFGAIESGAAGTAGSGGPGAIVLYRVQAVWHVLTPLFAAMAGDDGQFTLQTSLAVRNEPFNEPES